MKKASKIIRLKSAVQVDYTRTHDLTSAEVRTSPIFSAMNEEQVEAVIQTFVVFCKIFSEYIENQKDKIDFIKNGSDIAEKGKVIAIKPLKDKAA